jgi:L-ascorbate metabolism protein UlaG (beta-lactamase superfamily)
LLTLVVGVVLVVDFLGWFHRHQDWKTPSGWNLLSKRDQRRINRFLFSPKEAQGPEGQEAVEIFWLGHSGFLLRWKGYHLLIDPNLNERCTITPRWSQVPCRPEDLPPIDALLITHAHLDHMDTATLLSLSSIGEIMLPAGAATFLPPSLRDLPRKELREGATTTLGPLTIHATQAMHNGGRLHPFHTQIPALGFVIEEGGRSVYVAGDTAFGSFFQEIGQQFHPEVAILPIGAYAPAFPLNAYHLNPPQALHAATMLGVRTVIPCHFGTFRLSLEAPSAPLPWFAALAEAEQRSWFLPPLYPSKPR